MACIRVPEQKVILCGEFGVGKSSLFRRFAFDLFIPSSSKQSTLGLDNYSKEYNIDDRNIKLQLWDTGGMERVASITSSYYKFAEAAILVFSLDNAASFHILSQHILDVVTYAENAKIFLCGNKMDLEGCMPQVSSEDMDSFSEQCHNLICATYKTCCKTGEGVEEMFSDIALHLIQTNKFRLDLHNFTAQSFKIHKMSNNDDSSNDQCSC